MSSRLSLLWPLFWGSGGHRPSSSRLARRLSRKESYPTSVGGRLFFFIVLNLDRIKGQSFYNAESGFIAHKKRQCFVGEAFSGMEVSIDEAQKPGLALVCFANVKLGWLENSPNARLRLRPTPSVGRAKLAIMKKEAKQDVSFPVKRTVLK